MSDFRRKNIRLPASFYVGRQWYFLTLCTQDRVPIFGDADLVRELLCLIENEAQTTGFDLQAYCFMPDHVHLLASGRKENSDLQAFVQSFKQRSGYAFRRAKGLRLWQHKYYDHILRRDERWQPVAWYIWMNPVRKGLCAQPQDWPNSGSLNMNWRKLMMPPGKPWLPPWKHRSAAL